jgi:hypothetical protein
VVGAQLSPDDEQHIIRVAQVERDLAELAVALLRDGDVTDEEIRTHYTRLCPQADRAYERLYWMEHGLCISAVRVKAHMRRLLAH